MPPPPLLHIHVQFISPRDAIIHPVDAGEMSFALSEIARVRGPQLINMQIRFQISDAN